MPAETAKQFNFMRMMASGKGGDRAAGPTKEVAKEFVKKTPKKKRKMFAKKMN